MSSSSPRQDLLNAEQHRLNASLSLRTRFRHDLEQSFQGWLQEKAMSFLREYINILVMLYALVVCVTLPKLYFHTDAALQAPDLRTYWSMVLALGLDTLAFAFFVRQARFDRWFWLYSPVVDIVMLTAVSVGMVALQEPANVRIAMAILVVCFTIVFCTGMQPLQTCVRIAVVSFFLTLLLCRALGLMAGFWNFAFQFAVIFAGMALICHFMMRSHRQTFLHEQQLQHDRERLTALSDQLADLSLKDALTGVANRRRFDEVLQREWERGQRQQSPLAMLFIDIDYFKAYNDHYGHQAGDDCLMAVAFVLQDAARRPGDLVARYGGEEFVLLLPDTDVDGAMDTARRIQAFLRQATLPHAASVLGMVTASIGVAVVVPDASAKAADLVAGADRAVYAAKAEGRNGIRQLAADGRLLA